MIAPVPEPTALTLPLRTPRPAVRVPVMAPPLPAQARFTVDGSPELEQHLATTCARIAAGIRGLIPADKLEAVLLGGGYGRGEGGVLRTAAGDQPYNDLEFYVVLRGNRHLNEQRFGRALHVLGEILTPQAGVEVEFKLTTLPEFERAPVSMFSYDLLAGHRWLIGAESLLARCQHHARAADIPLREATRLLMNRCTGLLLAQERLARAEFTAADADFVRRNLAKAQLALGDAVLVTRGQYHWSARERSVRLGQLAVAPEIPGLADILAHHASGVRFKLQPERSAAPREELQAAHAALTPLARDIFLWVETQRLGPQFASAETYATSAAAKCPDEAPARNRLVNLKALGWREAVGGRGAEHPRQRVLHALALLLWAEPTAENVARVQAELGTTAERFPELVRAYASLWAKVN